MTQVSEVMIQNGVFNINTALSLLEPNSVKLVIADEQKLNSDFDLTGKNIIVECTSNGKIVLNGHTFTDNGKFRGSDGCFDYSLGGSVAGLVDQRVEWHHSGSGDYTNAFNKMIDSFSTDGGYWVGVKNKTYLISDCIKIEEKSNISFDFNYSTLKVIDSSVFSSGLALLLIENSNNWEIKNGYFNGNKENVADSYNGIQIKVDCSNFKIENNTIINCKGNGIYIQGFEGSFGDVPKITNNAKYYLCYRSHTSSAINEPGVGADWENYWIETTFFTGFSAWALSTAYSTPSSPCDKIMISGNNISYNDLNGIYSRMGNEIQIDNKNVIQYNDSAILFNGGFKNSITGKNNLSFNSYGVKIDTSDGGDLFAIRDYLIEDNIIKTNSETALWGVLVPQDPQYYADEKKHSMIKIRLNEVVDDKFTMRPLYFEDIDQLWIDDNYFNFKAESVLSNSNEIIFENNKTFTSLGAFAFFRLGTLSADCIFKRNIMKSTIQDSPFKFSDDGSDGVLAKFKDNELSGTYTATIKRISGSSQTSTEYPLVEEYLPALPTDPALFAYRKGSRIINSSPVAGQPVAWTCVVDGKPGTWATEGNL